MKVWFIRKMHLSDAFWIAMYEASEEVGLYGRTQKEYCDTKAMLQGCFFE